MPKGVGNYRYRLFDRVIASEIELDLPIAKSGKPAARIVQNQRTFPEWEWYHVSYDDRRQPVCAYAQGEGGFLVRFHGIVDFFLCRQKSEIEVRVHPGVTRYWQYLLLNEAIPLLFVGRDRFFLHASVVSLRGRAFAFFGPSGAGKSTLAARLIQRGFRLLADDRVLLIPGRSGIQAVPGLQRIRLHDDSAQRLYGESGAATDEKHFIAPARQHLAQRSAPLRALFTCVRNAPARKPSISAHCGGKKRSNCYSPKSADSIF